MKILIYGLAKSGTTILAEKIRVSLSAFLGENITSAFEPKSFSIKGGRLSYVKNNRSQMSVSSEVVKTLFDSGVPPEQVDRYQDHFDKKIFITRDPRDRYISQIFYRWYAGHKPDPEQFSYTHSICRMKEHNPQAIPFMFLASRHPGKFQNIREDLKKKYGPVSKFLKTRGEDWFILRYEDLVDGNVRELEAYLGFTLEKNVSVAKSHKRVARSKAHGNWRRWFTEEDVSFLRSAFTPFMKSVGYDIDDWELQKVKTLPKSEGSAYIEKLFKNKHEYRKRSVFSGVHHFLKIVLDSKVRHKFFPKVFSSEPYLFLHIPKTGGSSFRESLKNMVGKDSVIEDNPNRNECGARSADFFVKKGGVATLKNALFARRNAWLVGHVKYEKYADVFTPERMVSFVRHPVDRVISAYKHKCRHKGLDLSLEEFVVKTKIHNAQSRSIPLGIADRFAFIGVTDRYSLCINLLNKKFDWNLIEVERQVAPLEQQVLITNTVREMILERNQEDLALYKLASKRVEDSALEIGVST